jgi:HEPN domain-containing protein
MATRVELRDLAALRLREAESLFAAGLFDGCVYLCGYVVELALKARICATLDVDEYPNRQHFKTHNFDELSVLAGLSKELSAANPVLWNNWAEAIRWRSDSRYEPRGTYNEARALKILKAITDVPDGVLTCISRRW